MSQLFEIERYGSLQRRAFRCGGLLLVSAVLVAAPLSPSAHAAPAPQATESAASGTVIVYFIDHQLLPPEEVATLRDEVAQIFASADLSVDWVVEDSPRRRLNPNELRLVILASDGTNWFHGPSNVIGIAPHDDAGTGKNCFVFYRQAIWFRQQAVFRCRESILARTEAEIRGVPVQPHVEAMAPADCGDRLPSLTAMIVARAAAHELVHILLNKLDHSPAGLMRGSFDIADWFEVDNARFRLGADEIQQLRALLGNDNPGS